MGRITHQQDIIERQIIAMNIARFDVATRKKSGSTLAHDGLYLAQLWGLIDLLREQNQAGHAVLIRPHGEHGMTLLGGLGTVAGPVVGAFLVVTMQNYLAQFGSWVTIIQGAIFVVCVLLFRRGIVGEALALARRMRGGRQEG